MKLAVLVGAWLLLQSRAVAAQPEPEPFRLLFTAFTGCPDQAQFVDWVMAKTGRARPAKAGEPGRTFVVSLRSDGDQVRGSLALVGPDGVTEEREVTAHTCEQAARAMSLVMALAIDPRSRTDSSAPPADSDAQAEETQNDNERAPARAPRRRTRRVQPTERAPQGPETPGLVVGAGAQWRTGVAPDATIVPNAFVEVRLLPSMVAAGALGFARRSAGTGLGDAMFTFVAAGLQLCRWFVESPVVAGPCVGVTAGGVGARGENASVHGGVVAAPLRVEGWLEPGLAAKVGWQPAPWAMLRVDAGLGVPVVRPRYYFQGSDEREVVYAVPAWTGAVGFGAGMVFY
jgi:hypothetical protein